MSHLHTAIFGPGLSGKTSLARYLSRFNHKKHGVESLVLDPVGSQWGEQAKVYISGETDDGIVEEAFWREVWSSERKLVIVDEGSNTINRRQDLIPAFTKIRHNRHKLIVIGHRGAATLLPIMRDQISTLYLFRQTEKAVDVWVEQFVDERLRAATQLQQYEFIRAELFGSVVKTKLSERELKL